MSEIRIDCKQYKEFEGYSKSVQEYHKFDIYDEDTTDNQATNKQFIAEAYRKQLIILAGMSENEYEELKKSLKNHIVQKRIRLAEQRKDLMKLAEESSDGMIYPYCVDIVQGNICSPLAVFGLSELEQAKEYAHHEYEKNFGHDCTIQLNEGLFDKDGNVLGNQKVTFVIEEWSNE